ncbi:YceI family protein [Pseudofulvibacter geojedonensis]|uniref:YceI family protein n=1 Tax=Pseudofulvibacter geojedonensis TaxID=1123758 RepID=A0ABW3I530_9FLAO
MKRVIFLAICLATFISCKKENKQQEENKTETVAKATTYQVDPSVTTVEWTAYKTTAKTPVKGKFLNLNIDSPIQAEAKQNAFEGLTFNIPVSSFFSNNEERDTKIKTVFWAVMKETSLVSGNFSDVKGNEESGTMNLNLKMNGETIAIPMQYSIVENKVLLNGTINNLLDWKMEEAFNSLHKACETLHTGEDGVSKTWQEVAINAVAVLKTK